MYQIITRDRKLPCLWSSKQTHLILLSIYQQIMNWTIFIFDRFLLLCYKNQWPTLDIGPYVRYGGRNPFLLCSLVSRSPPKKRRHQFLLSSSVVTFSQRLFICMKTEETWTLINQLVGLKSISTAIDNLVRTVSISGTMRIT